MTQSRDERRMRSFIHCLRCTCQFAVLAAVSAQALADVEMRRPGNGQLRETCDSGSFQLSCRVTANLTDSENNFLPAQGWPKDVVFLNRAEGLAGHVFEIPGTIINTATGKSTEVRDVRQTTDIGRTLDPLRDVFATAQSSDLSIEAVAFNASTGTYFIDNIFAVVADRRGLLTPVEVPDLFADTNGDGSVGEGDVLYALVDLNVYLDSFFDIEIGQTWDIIDGQVSGLPGMRFSSTPFSFSASSGFDDGTPFSGPALTSAIHELTALPLPSSAALAALAVVASLGVCVRSRRRQRHPDAR